MSKRIYILTEQEKEKYENAANLRRDRKTRAQFLGKIVHDPEKCPSCNRSFYRSVSVANGHPGYCRKKCFNRGPNYTLRAKERGLPLEVKRLRRAERREERLTPKHETKQQYRARSLTFFNSDRWKKLRFEAFARFGRICLCCGAKPPQVIIHVDHIKPRMTHPDLEWDINNLQVLCEACNLGKGTRTEDFRPND